MINFCTLFDSNYLSRGLALYESLVETCPSFHLYIVNFDQKSYDYLAGTRLPYLTPISLAEFEDDQLLAVKPGRSSAEYCWTCTPSIILYCLEKFNLPACTYIDADMIFYHDPGPLLEEMGERSILISEHRYTKEYDRAAAVNGIYCVQFMCFKKDKRGMEALLWWRDRCLEWCYARPEDGKFGDQKYLDDWPVRFEGVHVMQYQGGALAPWNIQQYSVGEGDKGLFVTRLSTGQSYPVIFFHFHALKLYTDGKASCSGSLYELNKTVKALIYIPYLKTLLKTGERLKKEGIDFNPSGAKQPAPGPLSVITGYIKELAIQFLSGAASPFSVKNYNFILHYHICKTDSFNR